MPAEMHAEEMVKDDGRYLIFYTFPPEAAAPVEAAPSPETPADV